MCLKLLLKHGAKTDAINKNGNLAIFKAIKSTSKVLELFMSVDKGKSVNVLNKKGLSPLCKLAGQRSLNTRKIQILLSHHATCSKALPDFHPLFFAI